MQNNELLYLFSLHLKMLFGTHRLKVCVTKNALLLLIPPLGLGG